MKNKKTNTTPVRIQLKKVFAHGGYYDEKNNKCNIYFYSIYCYVYI